MDDEPAGSPPELHCRHLIVCRSIWFDPAKPADDEPITAERLEVSV